MMTIRDLAGPSFALTPLALAMSLVLAPGLVHAEDAPAEAPKPAAKPANDAGKVDSLEAVVVTARRREESLKDVPVAVTAFTAAALESKGIQNISDLQGEVPSLTIYAARGSNTTLTTYIRGVGQSDPLWGVDPGVGLYFDDVYIARPQGALLDVFDTERIEVLRGPQGTLYGKNTIGGAVKYVSKPLDTSTGINASTTFGSYNQLNTKATVNVASDDGQLRMRVAAADLEHGGYGKDLADGSDVSNQNTQAGRVALGYYPKGMPFTAQFSADYTRDQSNMRGFQRLNVNPFDPAKTAPYDSRYDINSGMPNKNSTTSSGNALTLNWTLDETWTAKYITALRQSGTHTGIDFDGLPNKIADVFADYNDSSRSHELQFSYEGQNNSGVMGLYVFDGWAGGQVRNNFFNLLFGTTGGTVYTKSEAAYADWSWKLGGGWGTSAGVRYTEEEKHAVVLNQSYANAQFTTPIATSANFDQTRKVSNVAPKFSVDYALSSTTNLYASASRGFKSGGYNVRANTAAVPASGRPFDDETLDSYELGAKMSFDQGRFELNTAVFNNNYKNVQLSVFTSYTMPNGTQGFFGDFTNAGAATVRGLEVEFAWRPDQVWTVSGNVSRLDAFYTEFMSKGVNIASSQYFTNTPKLSGALDLEAKFAAPWGGQLKTRFNVSYRSKVYPTTDLSESLAQSGYSLVNAGLSWERDKHWTFSLLGSNLSDKAYKTDGYNIAALGILDAYYGPPRTFSVTAAYRY